MSKQNGITDGTKLCRSEQVGNCFALLCVMHTHSRQTLMWKEINDRTIFLKKIKNCLKLYLSFECCVNEPHPRSQDCPSSKVLGILINLIKECFPRDEGWGWNLPKMHAFAKMPHNMLKIKSGNNFSGNIGEQALKGIVKDHVEKSQRQPDKFAEQCAVREYESNVIKYVMTDISNQIGVSTHSSKNNNEMWESRGRYTIHFCKTDNRGVGLGKDKVFWHDSKR
jgi:hypothetical protein